jgi:hypothetical protein
MLFTLRVFVLRDDFSERINRVIRGFAVAAKLRNYDMLQ